MGLTGEKVQGNLAKIGLSRVIVRELEWAGQDPLPGVLFCERGAHV